MTWVKGQTTWANLSSDLTKLICGEMADGSGTTVASGDRWLREYDTTVDAIRTPASTNVASGSCSMRAGYWALTTPGVNGLGRQTFCRQTVVRTALAAGVRQTYRLQITQVNSVAGDYSTGQVTIYAWDADTGNYVRTGNTVALTAAGDCSFDGMTVRFGNPTGLLELNLQFFRHFTSTYSGGVDYWPMYARRAAAVTFQTAPPGVAGTDYDVIEDCPTLSYCSQSTTYSGGCHTYTRSNWGTGLGIKTNAGLTGAVYACSFPIALHKARIFNRTDQLGTVGLTVGRMSIDGSVYRPNAAQEVSSWLRPFQTPAQVVGTAAISYWMSVKADGIVVVLSGDPGLTGKTTVGWLGSFTAYDTNYDLLPEVYSGVVTDYTGDNTVRTAMDQLYREAYWASRRKLDGTEGARDWQTRWMRCDLMENGAAWSGQAYTWDLSATFTAWGTMTNPLDYGSTGHPSVLPIRQLKPHPFDARWWLYGVAYGDVAAENVLSTPANPGTMDHRQIRGVVNARWWYLPGDGWANLDELTDSSNGNKYMLVAADYQGVGGRNKIGTSLYTGGIAIAEV